MRHNASSSSADHSISLQEILDLLRSLGQDVSELRNDTREIREASCSINASSNDDVHENNTTTTAAASSGGGSRLDPHADSSGLYFGGGASSSPIPLPVLRELIAGYYSWKWKHMFFPSKGLPRFVRHIKEEAEEGPSTMLAAKDLSLRMMRTTPADREPEEKGISSSSRCLEDDKEAVVRVCTSAELWFDFPESIACEVASLQGVNGHHDLGHNGTRSPSSLILVLDFFKPTRQASLELLLRYALRSWNEYTRGSKVTLDHVVDGLMEYLKSDREGNSVTWIIVSEDVSLTSLARRPMTLSFGKVGMMVTRETATAWSTEVQGTTNATMRVSEWYELMPPSVEDIRRWNLTSSSWAATHERFVFPQLPPRLQSVRPLFYGSPILAAALACGELTISPAASIDHGKLVKELLHYALSVMWLEPHSSDPRRTFTHGSDPNVIFSRQRGTPTHILRLLLSHAMRNLNVFRYLQLTTDAENAVSLLDVFQMTCLGRSIKKAGSTDGSDSAETTTTFLGDGQMSLTPLQAIRLACDNPNDQIHSLFASSSLSSSPSEAIATSDAEELRSVVSSGVYNDTVMAHEGSLSLSASARDSAGFEPSPSILSRSATILIEAAAGSGKTTMCRYICLEQNTPPNMIALFVDLPGLQRRLSPGTAAITSTSTTTSDWRRELIRAAVSEVQGGLFSLDEQAHSILTSELMSPSQVRLWVLDGFDEVSSSDVLQLFCKEFVFNADRGDLDEAFRNDIVLITSRFSRGNVLQVSHMRGSLLRLHIAPWDVDERRRFVESYARQVRGVSFANTEALLCDIEVAVDHPEMEEWCGVPLIVEMLTLKVLARYDATGHRNVKSAKDDTEENLLTITSYCVTHLLNRERRRSNMPQHAEAVLSQKAVIDATIAMAASSSLDTQREFSVDVASRQASAAISLALSAFCTVSYVDEANPNHLFFRFRHKMLAEYFSALHMYNMAMEAVSHWWMHRTDGLQKYITLVQQEISLLMLGYLLQPAPLRPASQPQEGQRGGSAAHRSRSNVDEDIENKKKAAVRLVFGVMKDQMKRLYTHNIRDKSSGTQEDSALERRTFCQAMGLRTVVQYCLIHGITDIYRKSLFDGDVPRYMHWMVPILVYRGRLAELKMLEEVLIADTRVKYMSFTKERLLVALDRPAVFRSRGREADKESTFIQPPILDPEDDELVAHILSQCPSLAEEIRELDPSEAASAGCLRLMWILLQQHEAMFREGDQHRSSLLEQSVALVSASGSRVCSCSLCHREDIVEHRGMGMPLAMLNRVMNTLFVSGKETLVRQMISQYGCRMVIDQNTTPALLRAVFDCPLTTIELDIRFPPTVPSDVYEALLRGLHEIKPHTSPMGTSESGGSTSNRGQSAERPPLFCVLRLHHSVQDTMLRGMHLETMRYVHSLSLARCSHVSPGALVEVLHQLPSLLHLNLSHCRQVNNEVLRGILCGEGCSNNPAESVVVSSLSQRLEGLNVSHCWQLSMSKATLTVLLDAMPRLRILHAHGCGEDARGGCFSALPHAMSSSINLFAPLESLSVSGHERSLKDLIPCCCSSECNGKANVVLHHRLTQLHTLCIAGVSFAADDDGIDRLLYASLSRSAQTVNLNGCHVKSFTSPNHQECSKRSTGCVSSLSVASSTVGAVVSPNGDTENVMPSLTELDLSHCQWITDDILSSFILPPQCGASPLSSSSLSVLSIAQCSNISSSSASIRSFTSLVHVKYLDISGTLLDQTQCVTLVKTCSHLMVLLCAECTGIDDSVIEALASNSLLSLTLKRLDISGCRGVTDGAMVSLAKLLRLQQLSMNRMEGLTDACAMSMRRIAPSSLKSLRLAHCPHIHVFSVWKILQIFSRLVELDVSELVTLDAKDTSSSKGQQQAPPAAPTDGVVTSLLFRGHAKFTTWTFAYMTSLSRLKLSKCPLVVDDTLEALGKLQTLEALWVDHCPFLTDGGIAHLKALPRLWLLDVRGCSHLTFGALEHATAKQQQHSKSFGVLIPLSGLASLEVLGLVDCSDRSLRHSVWEVLECFPSLRAVSFKNHSDEEGALQDDHHHHHKPQHQPDDTTPSVASSSPRSPTTVYHRIVTGKAADRILRW